MFFEAAIQSMSRNQKFFLGTPKVKIAVSKKKLYLKQLKFGINSFVMLLKEMNLQIVALLFQDLSEIQILKRF